MEQLFELKGLGDESLDAEACDLDGLANGSKPVMTIAMISGYLAKASSRFASHRRPAAEVGYKNVEGEVVQPIERLFAGRSLFDPEPMIDEALGHCLSKSAFVVDKQQMLLRNFAHLCVAVF